MGSNHPDPRSSAARRVVRRGCSIKDMMASMMMVVVQDTKNAWYRLVGEIDLDTKSNNTRLQIQFQTRRHVQQSRAHTLRPALSGNSRACQCQLSDMPYSENCCMYKSNIDNGGH